MDRVIALENRRMRLGLNKTQLCEAAGIKKEMYSYILKRARLQRSLPEECMAKVKAALDRLSKRKVHGNNAPSA